MSIAQDDALLTNELVSVLPKFMTMLSTSDTEVKAAAAVIAKTIVTLISDDHDDADASDQVNVHSIVLVAAAKHGRPNIVEDFITDNKNTIPTVIVIQAMSKAQTNNEVAIVKRLAQSIGGDGSGSAERQQHASDTGSDAEVKDNETFGQQTIQASGKLPRKRQQLGIAPLDSRF